MLIAKNINVHYLKEEKQNKKCRASLWNDWWKWERRPGGASPCPRAARLLLAALPLRSAAARQVAAIDFSSLAGKQQWEMPFGRDQCNWCNRLKATCCFACLALYSRWSVFDMLGAHVQVQGPGSYMWILHPRASGFTFGSWFLGLRVSGWSI